jgi:hypothetical protein
VFDWVGEWGDEEVYEGSWGEGACEFDLRRQHDVKGLGEELWVLKDDLGDWIVVYDFDFAFPLRTSLIP